MEFHGKVVAILPVRSGVSQRTGEAWASQGFVLEADGQYTHRARFSLWGAERIQMANLQLGEFATAKFEIEAHENNGEWYNDLRCYDVVVNGISRLRNKQQNQQPRQQPQQQAAIPNQQAPFGGQPAQAQYYGPGTMPNQQAPYNAQPAQQPAYQQAPPSPYLTQEQIMAQQRLDPDPFAPRR